jgi:DNA-binding NarL/FixJ family response regulator
MHSIALVDDHHILLDGLKWVISQYDFVSKVNAYQSPKDLINDLEKGETFDLVVTDLQMPDMSGYQLIDTLRGQFPEVRILVMTMFNSAFVLQQIQAGKADGFFIKQGDQSELELALRTVLSGKTYWPADVIENAEEELATLSKLTKRETEILRLIAQNLNTKLIAQQLYISEDTVLTHRKNLMAKLEIHNTAGLVAFALKNHMN